MKRVSIADNPFFRFRQEAEKSLADAFKKLFPEIELETLAMERPANPDFGQLASSICFELAKKINERPFVLAQRLAKAIDSSSLLIVEEVAPAGNGYINFHVNLAELSSLTFKSVKELDEEYGLVKTDTPLRVIVEHTSANPLHPINVATARNPVLGDTIARLLKARGHTIYRHFYIDDVGRQSSVVAYGFEKLGEPKSEGKPDQFIGRIYTTTSCIIEINRLKKELARAKAISVEDGTTRIARELEDWVSVAAELEEKYPDLFDKLLEKIGMDEDSETSVKILNQAYETEDKKAKRLIRTVSELCLEGFKETLKRIDVVLDSWDWESELVWSGHVEQVLQRIKNSPYTFTEAGVTKFDAEKVIRELDLRMVLGLREGQEVPPLTLARADGTTLYTTRDLAYTLLKFEKAEKVINVIGMEQSLAQLQLKIALYALGHDKYADNLVHFAYNLVSFPGYKMSSRRGRYIPFDEVMDEAVKRAYEEVSKHSPQLSEQEKERIANFVGLGAVRYALVEVDTSKPVLFTWDRVLNFEKNSAPYIQYTHARACSILRKATRPPITPSYKMLREKLEQEIILAIASFPDTFIEAAEYLKPNMIADYANSLADKFNTFYNAYSVIKAEPQGLSQARLVLTDAVRVVLRNALRLIGILAPEKM